MALHFPCLDFHYHRNKSIGLLYPLWAIKNSKGLQLFHSIELNHSLIKAPRGTFFNFIFVF